MDLRSAPKTTAHSAFFTMATEHKKPLAGPAQVELKSHLLRGGRHGRATAILAHLSPSAGRPPLGRNAAAAGSGPRRRPRPPSPTTTACPAGRDVQDHGRTPWRVGTGDLGGAGSDQLVCQLVAPAGPGPRGPFLFITPDHDQVYPPHPPSLPNHQRSAGVAPSCRPSSSPIGPPCPLV